jgi:TRAP transporter 4TM/12TM fusion protein
MSLLAEWIRRVSLAAITILAVLWVFDVPLRLGWGGILQEQFYLLIAGLATGAGIIHSPFGRRAGTIEVALAIVAIAVWGTAALYVGEWLADPIYRPAERWIAGLVAMGLLLLALYQNVGLAITLTMGLIGLYSFVGHWFPGVLEGQYVEPRRLILYLFYDPNGVPGLVLGVASTLVLCFIVFSKSLEAAGAGNFFERIAMAGFGNYRGGPAKVAVVSSGLFGMINGSPVANVASSGIVTIPLMMRTGIKPSMAAGIEANASYAGQITPPVMGATAFLIAEFLQIPYRDVVIAAAIPAALFYFVLFMQVDIYAARNGLVGLPRSELPSARSALADGWIYIVPLATLVYLLFFEGTRVQRAALYAAGIMLALALVRLVVKRDLDWRKLIGSITVGVGAEMLPILLVSAAAGIVIGSLNISGLAFTITLILTQVGQAAGIVPMLAITGLVAIVLGMGLPTSAVYVLLSVILAPALVKMGLFELGAHMFIFYLGMMSFLTPPVAMASYTAAAIARTDLWTTSVYALRTGMSGYFLPFLFVLNPALLLHGSAIEIVYAIATVALSGTYLAWAAEGSLGAIRLTWAERVAAFALAAIIGTVTLWSGSDSPVNVAVIVAGAGFAIFYRRAVAARRQFAA